MTLVTTLSEDADLFLNYYSQINFYPHAIFLLTAIIFVIHTMSLSV